MGAAAILRYLAIPLRTAPLLLIGIFSVLLVVATKAGLVGIPLGLILLSWFTKYSFVLMDHLAEGVVEPPVLSMEMVNPLSEQRPMVLLALTIGLFYAADSASYWIGERGALVLTFMVGAILPAVIAVQGATGMVVQSLNPRRVLSLIARLRGDYLVILGFIGLVWLVSRFIVESSVGGALPLVLRIALLMYAWLVIFSLLGGVLWERRLDIGLDDAHTPESFDTGEDDAAPDERVRIGRSIASMPNGVAARTRMRGRARSRWLTAAATRSSSFAGCISVRRSGPTAASPIVWRASSCRNCWPSALPAKRSISCASD